MKTATLKSSKTIITFEKNFEGYSTQIEITFGRNQKGEWFQDINQINTSNDAINNIERDFENQNFEYSDLCDILTDEGYVRKGSIHL